MSSCGIQILKIPFGCEYIVQGNTIPKTLFKKTSGSLDLSTVQSISLVLYSGSTRVENYSIGSGITVVDSDNFEIDEVASSDNNLPVGDLIGDLDIKDVNGVEKTYARVQYKILKQYR